MIVTESCDKLEHRYFRKISHLQAKYQFQSKHAASEAEKR